MIELNVEIYIQFTNERLDNDNICISYIPLG